MGGWSWAGNPKRACIIARGERLASRVETGMMFINNIDWSGAELPFGGIKNSGYGPATAAADASPTLAVGTRPSRASSRRKRIAATAVTSPSRRGGHQQVRPRPPHLPC